MAAPARPAVAAPPVRAAVATVAPRHAEAWPDAVVAKGSPWQPAVTGWIVMGLLFALATLGLARLRRVPGFFQNLWEFTLEWVENIAVQVLGDDAEALLPYFFSVFVFVLAGNLLGLIPYLASPTANTSTTWALALCTFFLTHAVGFRRQGLGYVSHYFHIVDASHEKDLLGKAVTLVLQWVMLPAIEGIGEIARPVSLSIRLFGNIFAKEVLLMVLAALLLAFFQAGGAAGWSLMVMPLVLRPGILVLGVLVSLIQAAVFMGLSMIYVGGALAGHADHGHDQDTGGMGDGAVPAA